MTPHFNSVKKKKFIIPFCLFTFTFRINNKIYSIYNRMFRDPFFNDLLVRETEKENQKIISKETVLRKCKNVKKYNMKKRNILRNY